MALRHFSALRGPSWGRSARAEQQQKESPPTRPSAAERARTLAARTSHAALTAPPSSHVWLAQISHDRENRMRACVHAHEASEELAHIGQSISLLIVPNGSLPTGERTTHAMILCFVADAQLEHNSSVVSLDLDVESVRYFGSQGPEDAVDINGSDFTEAQPDPLCTCAERIVGDFNSSLPADDLARLARHAGLSSAPPGSAAAAYFGDGDEHALVGEGSPESERPQLVWVDRLGVDLSCGGKMARSEFLHQVRSESEARSAITMLAQELWEHESRYSPPSPLQSKVDEEYVA